MRQNVWTVLGLAVALLATGCTGKYKKQVSEKDARIAELEGQVRSLEGKVADEESRSEELSKELAQALSDYREREQVWLAQKDGQSIVTVSDAVLFGSGNADLSSTGTDIVDRIAKVALQDRNRSILIEGHTDNVPIGANIKERFQSNWELSSGRACSVARYLYWKHKMDPKRLSAIGYGEHRPLTDNDTSKSRAKNRRVVIKIGPVEE